MGTWGIKTFENDAAMDWLEDFLEDPSEQRILEALSTEPTIFEPGLIGKLMGKKPQTFPTGLNEEEALAAAEVVAMISGRPADSNPDDLKNLPNISLHPDTTAKAVAAIDAIMTESNLKGCWEETEEYEEWKAEVNDLRKRLSEQ